MHRPGGTPFSFLVLSYSVMARRASGALWQVAVGCWQALGRCAIKGTGESPRQVSHVLPEWRFLGNKVGLNLHNMLNIWQFLYRRRR